MSPATACVEFGSIADASAKNRLADSASPLRSFSSPIWDNTAADLGNPLTRRSMIGSALASSPWAVSPLAKVR